MGQVGSSHLNETFSIEWDATAFGGQMKPTVADDNLPRKWFSRTDSWYLV